MRSDPTVLQAAPDASRSLSVSIDFGVLAHGLTGVVANGVAGSWADALTSLAGLLPELRKDEAPEQLAWKLVTRALSAATIEIARPYFTFNPNLFKAGDSTFIGTRKKSISSFQFHQDHLRRPEKLECLPLAVEAARSWLTEIGAPPVDAKNLSGRLKSLFIYAIYNEHKKNHSIYAPLLRYFESPFNESAARTIFWDHYRGQLAAQIAAPVFAESFSLQDIYIWPRAYFVQKKNGAGTTSDEMLNSLAEKKNITLLI